MAGLAGNESGAMGRIAKRIHSVASDITTVRTGTVVTDDADPSETLVALDNDPAQVPLNVVSSYGFPLPKGTRVALLAFPPRGLLLIGPMADYDIVPNIPQLEDTGWLRVGVGSNAAFENSWGNYAAIDANWEEAAYRRIGGTNGWLYIRGMVRAGTLGAAMFTLPVGFRPPQYVMYAGVTNQQVTNNNVNTGTDFTDGANITTTSGPSNNTSGAASTGTAHTHSLSSHTHTLAHQHSAVWSITNMGTRIDVGSNGAVYAADSLASNGYVSILSPPISLLAG